MKTLIVAPWGNPTTWSLTKYSVDGLCVESCSSYLALYEKYRGDGPVKGIILSMVSILDKSILDKCGGDGHRLSQEAQNILKDWLSQLLSKSSLERARWSEALEDTQFLVTQAVGKFGGLSFRGSLGALVVAVASKLMRELEGGNYDRLVLDITHGVNYQTMASLTATNLASLATGKKETLILMNSEPISKPKASPRCISTAQGQPAYEGDVILNIEDVSELEKALSVMEALSRAFDLDDQGLRKVMREGLTKKLGIRDEEARQYADLVKGGEESLKFIVNFTTYLRNCLPIFAYEELLNLASLKVGNDAFFKKPCELLNYDLEGNEVRFRLKVSSTLAVLATLPSLVKCLVKEYSNEDLEEFLTKLQYKYKNMNLIANYNILTNELNDLYKNKEKDKTLLSKCKVKMRENFEVSGEELHRAWMRKKGKGSWGPLVKWVLSIISVRAWMRKKEDIVDKRRMDVDIRNVVAHAGFNYEHIKRIKFNYDGNKIKLCQVEYKDYYKEFVRKQFTKLH